MPNRYYQLFIVFVICFILFDQGAVVVAVEGQLWVSGTQETLQEVELRNIAVSKQGSMSLSRNLEKIATFDRPVFSLLSTSKTTILAGTGDKSAVYAIERGKGPAIIASFEGLTVHAMARGIGGKIYVANQANKSVDILEKDGSLVPFATFEDEYIWDMASDGKKSLFVATGRKARVYRISADGQKEIWFSCEQNHIMNITLLPDGVLLAGTEGGGILYRITGPSSSEILYDTMSTEIGDIAVTPSGDIYFSSISGSQQPFQLPPQLMQQQQQTTTVTIEPTEEEDFEQPDQQMDVSSQMFFQAFPPRSQQGPESTLYLLPAGGIVRTAWTLSGASIRTLIIDDNGGLIVGTGNSGSLYRFDRGHQAILEHKLDVKHVTTLAKDANGAILIGTALPGEVYRLDTFMASAGSLLAKPVDAVVASHWGVMTLRASTPPKTSIDIFVRNGNSENPDTHWSTWKQLAFNDNEAVLDISRMRFLQWKLEMRSTAPPTTPIVTSISISYRQENLPPMISSFLIQSGGGVNKQSISPQRPGMNGEGIFLNQTKVANNYAAMVRSKFNPETTSETGKIRFLWTASDPNGDRLVYDLAVRHIDQERWMSIASDIPQTQYIMETQVLPDGIYAFKLTASDRAVNPKPLQQDVTQTIDFHLNDTTAPVFHIKDTRIKEKTVIISGSIIDSLSRLEYGEYSVNSHDWELFFPLDTLFDQKTEHFTVTIPDLPAGEHFIILRARDRAGNFGRSVVIVTIKD